MKKNVIIDGDKFQKEYKKQFKKELITDLIQGIILLIIACSGLFFGSKLLLKIVIFIFPIFILTYAVNLFSMGISIIKTNTKQGLSFFIQSFIVTLFAVYIILNPLNTLGFVLVAIGALILANAIIKMIYFPNYLPIGSFIFGGILILFSNFLIDVFYFLVMIILLMIGISKISKSIYTIKNK